MSDLQTFAREFKWRTLLLTDIFSSPILLSNTSKFAVTPKRMSFVVIINNVTIYLASHSQTKWTTKEGSGHKLLRRVYMCLVICNTYQYIKILIILFNIVIQYWLLGVSIHWNANLVFLILYLKTIITS